jgi:hypothetical protein
MFLFCFNLELQNQIAIPRMCSKWVLPTQVDKETKSLTADQVESWREKGFALVDGLLPRELCDKAHDEAFEKLSSLGRSDFGSGGMMEYPCGLDACDQITLHLNILRAAEQLLNTRVKDLRLVQSDVWLKSGKEVPSGLFDNMDQRVHCGLFWCFTFKGETFLYQLNSFKTTETIRLCIRPTGTAQRQWP